MAVVSAGGGEQIITYSRTLVVTHYLLMLAGAVISLFTLLIGLSIATEAGSLKEKFLPVASWWLGTLSFALMAIRMFYRGRALSRTFVAIGPEGVRILLPTSDGYLLQVGKEDRLHWNAISDITYESSLRKRVCSFTAGDFRYNLTARNCPSPNKVAQLLSEWKGTPLTPRQLA